MKPIHPLLAVVCASIALTTSNCGDRTATGPTGPMPAAIPASVPAASQPDSQSRSRRPPNLVQCKLQKPETIARRIGPDGGTIEIGPYTLTIPPGALPRRVTIVARIRGGESANVVEFKPNWVVFEQSASLSMSYATCDVDEDAESALRIAVVDEQYQIVDYLPSTTDTSSQSVIAPVTLIRNYAVAY
jgi:hypothetical protein